MTIYKTVAKNEEGNSVIVEMEYPTKADFIHDLRANGYKVNDKVVKTKAEWDRIVDTTNANKWDWQTKGR